MKLKKCFVCALIALMLFSVLPLTVTAAGDELVLRVYNWQEYIDDGTDSDGNKVASSVMEDWAADYEARTGKKVRVQYDTFETNETMLNTLRTGKTQYDLVCPSDYIIQKMISATVKGSEPNISLEKFDLSAMDNYTAYVSPYISDLFEENGWSEYAVGYMWGTVGFLYDPQAVEEADVASWDVFWNEAYKNQITTKDVSRDAYIPGVMHVYKEELLTWKAQYEAGTLDAETYNKNVNELMNRVDDETLALVEQALKDLKTNIYGFEVDSGKADMVSGKIHINQAWSGDAVYAMDLAEEEDGVELAYSVPEEGSSIWFDGWVMPKGANVELAQDFVNYLCDPAIAVRNMEFIGYTSAIAGNDVYDLVQDWYGDDEGEYEVDLTYFFQGTVSEEKLTDGKILVRTSELGRQFSAQYPEYEVLIRCAVMEDFGDRNDAVLKMWSKVKANSIPPGLLAVNAVAIAAVAAVFLVRAVKNRRPRR